MIKICECCNIEFNATKKKQKYCSKVCGQCNKRQVKIIKECEFTGCTNTFEKYSNGLKIFCSRKCQVEWQKYPVAIYQCNTALGTQELTSGKKCSVMLITTGPNKTVISAGNTQKIKGISNLTGSLAAASSAINRRLVLSASEWTSSDSAMLLPNRSA